MTVQTTKNDPINRGEEDRLKLGRSPNFTRDRG